MSVVADERGVRVEVTANAVIQGDKILVQRASTNLLTNARRHAEVPSVVSVTFRNSATHAFVDVSNRAPGIPGHQITRVFDRFVRLDAARARSDGTGTGQGLPIVKSVMHAHSGGVEVMSERDGTTTFSLVFLHDAGAANG